MRNEKEISAKFKDLFENKTYDSRDFVAKIQENYECCGLDSHLDYKLSSGEIVSLLKFWV